MLIDTNKLKQETKTKEKIKLIEKVEELYKKEMKELTNLTFEQMIDNNLKKISYRKFREGEFLSKEDEFFGLDGRWHNISVNNVGKKLDFLNFPFYRRPIIIKNKLK